MSKETFDAILCNHSGNRPISKVLEVELSRRGMLKRTAVVSGLVDGGLSGCGSNDTT